MTRFQRPVMIFVLVALSASGGYLAAQQRNAGIRSTEIARADLGAHFECLEGKELKLTRHEIDPHKGGGEHSHLGRPEVFYVLEGSVVEHQGSSSKVYSAGEGFVSNADMSVPHRIENASDSVTIVLDAQIASKPTTEPVEPQKESSK